jgi:hypothetical protein
MTARDEAIDAIADRITPPPLFREDFGRLIDAISGPVLARLAIERGALVFYERRQVIHTSPDEQHIETKALYWLVEP